MIKVLFQDGNTGIVLDCSPSSYLILKLAFVAGSGKHPREFIFSSLVVYVSSF